MSLSLSVSVSMAAWCLENNGVSSSQSSITEEPLAAPSSNACMQKFRLYETRSVIAFLSFLIFLYIYKISSFFFFPRVCCFWIAISRSLCPQLLVSELQVQLPSFTFTSKITKWANSSCAFESLVLAQIFFFFFFFLCYRMLLFILEQVLEV